MQGSTVTDIQNQQVLDNLAMFACNPNAMAWHVKVTGGVVQVADQGGGIHRHEPGRTGGLDAESNVARNVLGQWNVDPVNEPDEIELLQIAYRKASIRWTPTARSSATPIKRSASWPATSISRFRARWLST